jgi:PPP family 3-phenylpropionic acid transporter
LVHLYHTASIQYIQRHFERSQQSRGQAIYIGGVYGLGGAMGAYVAGTLWLDGHGAITAFNFAAIMALSAALIALFIPKDIQVRA